MRVDRLTGAETLARRADLTAVYRAAFGEPPWHEDERGAAAFAEPGSDIVVFTQQA